MPEKADGKHEIIPIKLNFFMEFLCGQILRIGTTRWIGVKKYIETIDIAYRKQGIGTIMVKQGKPNLPHYDISPLKIKATAGYHYGART